MSVFIIAEAGVNHNGEVELAKKLVDMAVRCKADAIKFQTFKAEECVNQYAEKVGYQKENDKRKESQYEMLKRLELSYNDFKELKEYCTQKGILFLSTPFGVDALEFLMSIDMPMIKLSSTEVTNYPYLKRVARFGKPIILSTGMSYMQEVEGAVRVIRDEGNCDITVLHCTTDYPTKLEDVNIRVIQSIKEELQVEVGYSDHTEGNLAAIAAVTLGVKIIEKHITLDKEMEGPDHKASMLEKEFKIYVESIRDTQKVLGDGIKKPTNIEVPMRVAVRRSIVAKKEIKAGTILSEELFEYKRPATGLSPIYTDKLIGKKIIKNLNVDEMVRLEDVEEN